MVQRDCRWGLTIGKALLILGLSITLVGAAFTWAPWLVSWFGHLPGDIRYERNGTAFYFPVVSLILISVVLSVILNLLPRR